MQPPRPALLDPRTPVRYRRASATDLTEALLLADPLQLTLDQGVPLHEVTFVVVDLETTGGSPTDSAITEIGAVTYRGGERLGSFQTLVNPCVPIPRNIVHLTGIDDRLVADAPPIDAVLPSFVEFARGAVFVAHNARFDYSFLNASLERADREPLPGPVICTAKLARRVVWPDVPNVRLQTLASYFRTRAEPVHRALADAEACAEVLHGLLEMGERLGIVTLGDLREACLARGRPNFGKITLADALPTGPGVYRFRSKDGRVLYVGTSKNVRARVKSYFYGDERKKIQDMLDEVASVDATSTAGHAEALVLEARLIARHEPPYNRHGKRWRSYAYLKIDPTEAWPRVKTSHAPAADVATLGPFPSIARARLAKEALEEAFAVRRCTRAMGRRTRFAPCALADMGRCHAPCDGRTTPDRYAGLVEDLIRSLSCPGELLRVLEARMAALAAQERFEEAALARDRLRALAEALWRARIDRWLTAGRLALRTDAGGRLELDRGSLRVGAVGAGDPIGAPPPRERADELAALRSWVCRHRLVVERADVAPCEPVDGGRDLARILRVLRDSARDPRDGRQPRTRG